MPRLIRRLCHTAALAVVFGVALSSTAQAAGALAPPQVGQIIHLHAKHIAFYYNRFVLTAQGNVRVQTGDGATVTGQVFTMDLKLDRFLVAGHVTVTWKGGVLHGAAFSDFLAFHRIYFVPLTTEPDRWTYKNGDFAHPLKGRQMPGDTFGFAHTEGQRPFLTSSSAVIGADSYVRFGPSRMPIFGVQTPLPSFYIGFSSNPNLSQNSLAGSNADITYNITGNAYSTTAVHLRYDTQNKFYYSFEQHLADANKYLVFSVNPLSLPSKYWNLVTGAALSSRFQIHTFSQLHTYQYGFSQPLEAQQASYINLTQAFAESAVQANFQFVNYSLLGQPLRGYYGPSTSPHYWIPNHPSSLQLGATTFDHKIGRSPFHYTLNYGIGFNHSSYGLQNFGGVNYTTIWNHYVGGTIYLPSLKIGERYNPYKAYYLNTTFSAQRQWFSVPHHVDSTDLLTSVSRIFNQRLSAYVSYEVQNTGDYYNAGQQAAYPPYVPIIGGVSYPSYAAFKGVATLRTLSLGATWSPNPNFTLSVLARKHTDFPKPEPGLFGLPPTNVLGQSLVTSYLGQPPSDITGDVRVRVLPHLVLDVQRTYFFNFGTLRWSPQFVVQLIP
ncbi:MAG: hypothetical protein ACYDBU_08400 [Vulcanimicrobiaceae bacterium]